MNRVAATVITLAIGVAAVADPMRPSDFVPTEAQVTTVLQDPDFSLFGLMRRQGVWFANVNNKWLTRGDTVGDARVRSVTANTVTLQSTSRGSVVLKIEKKDIKRVAN